MSLRTDLANLVVNRALAGAAVVAVLAGGTAVLPDRGTAAAERFPAPSESTAERALPSAPPATMAASLPPAAREAVAEVRRATEPPVRPGPPDPLPAHADARSDRPEPTRSDVADRVHLVLAGGLQPGDDGFGQAVAERARADGAGLGAAVSAAARTAADEADIALGTDAAVPAPKGKAAGTHAPRDDTSTPDTNAPRDDTSTPDTTEGPRDEGPPASTAATDGPGQAAKPKGDRP